MRKLALIIGINYKGNTDELGGCINDATGILHKIVEDFGFNLTDIQLLIEEVATRENILKGLEWLVRELKSGDIGLCTFSGHGKLTADLPPIGEADMLDEAIVPIDAIDDDSNLIRDDEIHEILSKLEDNVKLVIIFDSCYSATGTRALLNGMRKRSIRPTETIQRIMETMNDFDNTRSRRESEHPLSGSNHILLSGCKANQLSWDDGSNGYFTKELLKNMKKGITYRELYELVREAVLGITNNVQDPQIEGPKHLLNMNIFE